MPESKSSYIAASYANINQKTSSQQHDFDNKIKALKNASIEPVTLTIDPLATPWHSEQKAHHFRSGCAPIMALEHATHLINQDKQAIIIEANEPLKTGYSREQRHQLMAVYDDETTIADLYNDLAQQFIKNHSLNEQQFTAIAAALFENYKATYQRLIDNEKAHFSLPSQQWYDNVTPLFRGVDCANPLIDFAGKLLICSEEVLAQFGWEESVKIAGVHCCEINTQDETKELKTLSQYNHLGIAFDEACNAAQINFSHEFLHHNALLEAYTCYPIVPMAFLLHSGIVKDVNDIAPFLQDYEITITGGMNLARAPWNAPSLNALIEMSQRLSNCNQRYGAVHGNGGLGYRQGVAILERI
ncbi:MAG: hypothetical protein ACPGR2_02030 [Psychrobium sp.]